MVVISSCDAYRLHARWRILLFNDLVKKKLKIKDDKHRDRNTTYLCSFISSQEAEFF